MGSTVTLPDGTILRVEQDLVDVTALSRPNPSWGYIDPAGHAHQWYVGEHVAPLAYGPELRYHLPTTELVQVGTTVYEDDDEETPIYERRCVLCGAKVEAGTASDETRQYIMGLRRVYINDQLATQEEVAALMRAHGLLGES
jgi:hypothetical protein